MLDGLDVAYGYESWTTANHLLTELRALTDASVVGPGHPLLATERSRPLLWIESGIPWMPPLAELLERRRHGVASAAWFIDTHRGLQWRLRAAQAFDMAFFAQRHAVQPAIEAGIPSHWLPLATPGHLLPEPRQTVGGTVLRRRIRRARSPGELPRQSRPRCWTTTSASLSAGSTNPGR